LIVQTDGGEAIVANCTNDVDALAVKVAKKWKAQLPT
jgi:hypothetical protein